ncbi:retinol dehydrogenase 13-like [Colias croceus]|uniref:retinol dehydrogenase 13-like n=1 Tax=Colias crocea TaxID=72248 RepID=UPI001E2800C0|nr:retinol dehydrogenase 13-like [Colias croceus]
MCNTESRLDGKTIIVTGGSAGIGYEAAKNLAYKGARVIIASRNKTKLIKAKDRLQKLTGNPLITYRQIDLASLKSVRNFASETLKAEERLDVLINNAGAVGLSDRLTEDGLNLTMQVNYFGAFLLTYLLLPLLKSSSPSRIINSSASSMYIGHLEFDHWNDIGRYNSIESLANSKLAVALFTAELGNKLKDTGVTANTFDPFIVRETDILNNIPGLIRNVSQLFVDVIGQPKEDVGREITFLAADPNMENVTGEHYKFCKKWINHWLVNEELLTKLLWDESKKVVNITSEEDWERVT